jgi:tellurite resistance protein TerC
VPFGKFFFFLFLSNGMNEIIFFTSFLVGVALVLLLDLGVFSKKSHVISFKEAAAWSVVWIVLALSFYAFLYSSGEIIHGISNIEDLQRIDALYGEKEVEIIPNDFETSLQNYRRNLSLEFITGYLLEYSLSVDNIFVVILIFASFGVREAYFKKVLFWGILGAVVMRFTFIFSGAALIHQFEWIIYLFGAFLVYTGFKMFKESSSGEDEKIDPQNHPVVKFLAKYFSVYPRYVGSRFFVRRNKNTPLYITPLFVVVIVIEATDLIFAVDSIPAIFGVTKDPYIVFFSNIFAILGLRSMFFFLSNIMHIFHYLKTGLAFLLSFIGLKMLFGHWLKSYGFKTEYSIYVILTILAISIIASLLFPKEKKKVKD